MTEEVGNDLGSSRLRPAQIERREVSGPRSDPVDVDLLDVMKTTDDLRDPHRSLGTQQHCEDRSSELQPARRDQYRRLRLAGTERAEPCFECMVGAE